MKLSIKPDGQTCLIKEQIIEDMVTNHTFQFSNYNDAEGGCKLTIYGNLHFGNRDIIFDEGGRQVGAGAAMSICRPNWLKEVKG